MGPALLDVVNAVIVDQRQWRLLALRFLTRCD
jgi:hypothetical protein